MLIAEPGTYQLAVVDDPSSSGKKQCHQFDTVPTTFRVPVESGAPWPAIQIRARDSRHTFTVALSKEAAEAGGSVAKEVLLDVLLRFLCFFKFLFI
jgi:hypothetical protein